MFIDVFNPNLEVVLPVRENFLDQKEEAPFFPDTLTFDFGDPFVDNKETKTYLTREPSAHVVKRYPKIDHDFQYMGSVFNRTNGILTALIKYGNNLKFLNEGDSIKNYQVMNIFPDSAILQSNGVKLTISR